MGALTQSIKRVKTVFDSIGSEIAKKGVTVPAGTKAGQYPALISKIQNGLIDSQSDYSHMFRDNKRIDFLMKGQLNTSHVTNMEYFAYDSKDLTQIKNLDISQVINADYMFYNCSKLTYINDSDTFELPNATKTSHMFSGCASLRNIKTISLPKTTNAEYLFYTAFENSSINIILPPILNAYRIFYYTKLASITIVSDTVITNANTMFDASSMIHTINGLNISGATKADNYSGTFSGCSSLKNITFSGEIKNFNISFSSSPQLTHESLINILNALCNNANAVCTLGSANLAKLTDEEKAIATAKGWELK